MSTPTTTTPSTPSAPAPPAVVSANGVIGVTVGASVAYDATKGGTVCSDPAGAGLTYRVTFAGSPNGLSANGGTVSGTPTSPGIVKATLTATDSRGRTVTDQFAVVAFAGDLPVPVLPSTLEGYSDARSPLPAHFTAALDGASVAATDNTPADNPITDAGATLGRVLFYDSRLSANDGIACSSCHVQSLGFGDVLEKSVGFDGGLTGRHTPAIANTRFYRSGRMFWDERAATLEAQVLMPIQSPVEMGMSLDDLVLKLRATPYYAPLFTATFGTPEVTSDRISRALSQFVRSLVSAGSRYDRAYAGGSAPNFAATLTAQEQQGEQLFRTTGCASCHTTVSQVSDGAHNIGLDATDTDAGAGSGTFKPPSLRNVAVRPRYMHDGRFTSLQQVVDFFDAGVQPNPNLDARLKAADGSPKRLGLTAAQKAALVAYMTALTDSAFITATKFSSPFAIIPPTPPSPSGGAVTIQGNAYHPATLTVSRGAVVTWTNLDNARHGATFAFATTPIFRSGSQTITMPTTPGTYNYQCPVHGAAMRGVIVVQ